MLRARDYESAFTEVLSSSNVDLLAWLCSQVQPDEMFGQLPPPLPQGVILSLIQQLGCDLSREPSARAAWIREAVLSLDMSEPRLMPHIQDILSQVQTALEQEMTQHDGSVKTELRLCMRVVSSLLRV